MKKALFAFLSIFLFAVPGFASAPVCLFTDVVSGPSTGGEGGNGIYLSIFGKNFGAARGQSTVTVNGQPVAQYLLWGHNNDVTGNLDRIAVQVSKATTGTGDIVVTTPAGSCSNLTFTVRPGNIWYIGPGIDNDAPGKSCAALESGTAGNGAGGNGTFASPWTLTNLPNKDTYSGSQGAYTPQTHRTPETYYNCMGPGDTLVFLNGTSFLWGDGTGMHTALILGSNGGSANEFMTFMARPGATVQLGSQGGTAFGIRDYADTYDVISGLNLTGSGVDGEGIEFTTAGAPNHMRLVGNTVTCPDCSGPAAAVSGGWELDEPAGLEILGNAVTDVSCADAGGVSNKQYHSMYFFGNDIEVGWNKIYNGCAYNGIQINYFTEKSLGFGTLNIHDNDISGANGAGINLASIDPAQGPINIFNNVIHHVGLQAASDGSSFHTCLAFPGEAPSAGPGAANVYNNTMYDCSSYLNKVADGSSCTVYMGNETGQTGLTVNLVNNILAQPAYANSASQNVYACGNNVNAMLKGTNNLFYSASTPGSIFGVTAVGSIANPQFVSTTAGSLDLNLTKTSPAIGAGSALLHPVTDFNGTARPTPPAIGAFEFGTPALPDQIGLTAAVKLVAAEESVMLTATVSQTGNLVPTGSVSFMNGGESLGQAPLNAMGTATLVVSNLAPGSYSVVADYTGDSNYEQGNSAAVSFAVAATTATTLAASANSVAAGQSLTLTATVVGNGGAAPAGTVNFLNGTTLLGTATLNAAGVGTLAIPSLAAGQYSITAQYAGNANFLQSVSSAVSVTAAGAKQATTATLAASANSIPAGQGVTLTATVYGSGNATPTGTVNFLNGATLLGSATLNAAGVGTLAIPSLATGQYSVTAQYAGNGGFASSVSPAVSITATGVRQATATALTATPNPATVGQSVVFTATVKWSGTTAPTGRVGFLKGSTLLGVGTVNANGVATLSTASLPAGTDSVIAVYTGDANFLTSTSPAVSVIVNLNAQLKADSTSLVASPATVDAGQTLTLTATVQWNGATLPTGRVGFLNGAKLLGTGTLNSSGVAKLSISTLPAGVYEVSAMYTGDANFATSTSPSIQVTVKLKSAAKAKSASQHGK